jgi:hypothetical protein
VIPPRLRAAMLRMFVHDHPIGKAKHRSVFWTSRITTNETQIAASDLRLLEKRGLIRFDLSDMSALFGVRFWDCTITDQGKEEIEDDFARLCAEADEENARKENPDPFGERGES